MKNIDFNNIRHLLVVRLDEVGDVVLTSPFLRELRRNLPNSMITLVVKANTLNLVQSCPYTDKIITFGREVSSLKDVLCNMTNAVRLGSRLRKMQKYDLAIVPRWDTDLYGAALMTYFSGATYRVGYSEKVNCHKRKFNCGFDHLFTHVIKDDTLRHEVERNLWIIRFLGGEVEEEQLELWLECEDKQFAERILGDSNRTIRVGFAPIARQRRRTWPLENFLEIALWCKERIHAQVVIIGGQQDKNVGERFKQRLGSDVINLMGKTTLRQMAAVLNRCDLFVTNDSGPLHVAAAMGVPVVEISCHPLSGDETHRHSPARFGPWKIPHVVLQRTDATPPCSITCHAKEAHCIRSVRVEDVQATIGKLLVEK